MPYYDERSPLLGPQSTQYISTQEEYRRDVRDIHEQFCLLAGVPPSNVPKNAPHPHIVRRSLYGRATNKRNAQNRTYLITAALTNTLLLSQVVLGAALTALGASESSHILITVFGALNTIIAGVVAYLKSRGQPMRAHMYRDDLDRVVDEIENSEIMWLGIQSGAHGYDEIAIDDSVSVRSEVARLTRLYDKVVKNNTMNDPDMYMNAISDATNAALRTRPGQVQPTPVITAPAAVAPTGSSDPSIPTAAPAAPASSLDDPDASPASAPPKSKTPPPPQDDTTTATLTPISETPKQADDAKSVTVNAGPSGSTGESAGGSLEGSLK